MTLEEFLKRGQAAQRAVDEAIDRADVSQGGGAATCAKCGRAFRSPSEYRYAAGLKAFICRDERACKARGGS